MRNIFRIEHKHLVNPLNPTILDSLAKRRRIKIELWLTNQLTFSDVIQPGDIVPAVWCISVAASWWPVPPAWKDIWEYSHRFQDISLSIIWRCDVVFVLLLDTYWCRDEQLEGHLWMNPDTHCSSLSFIGFICFHRHFNIPFCMSTTGLCRPFTFPVMQLWIMCQNCTVWWNPCRWSTT